MTGPRQREIKALSLVIGCTGILAVAALVLNGVTWYRLTGSIQKLREVQQQIISWHIARSLVQDVVSGQRGFLLTGDEAYVAPYERAVKALPLEWERLKRLKGADSGRLPEFRRVTHAEALAEKLIESARDSIALRRHDPSIATSQLVLRGEGKEAMDELRQLLQVEQDRLDGLMVKRTSAMYTDLQAGLLSSIATGILALGIGGIAIILIRRIIGEIRRAEGHAVERRRAEEGQRQSTSFLAMMSHEIRTPLNAILGFGELVLGEANNPATRRYAESIVAGGTALLQLLNDVLDLSKLEAGMMELHPEPVDIRALITFCERLFRENATLKGLTLRSTVEKDVPRSLLLDQVRLRQVLINLIGNAVKFTESGQVSVAVRGQPRQDDSSRWDLTVAVSDSGPGIATEVKERIFQPFVHNNPSSGATSDGTGLGLAIVHRFVSLMRGTVRVESEPGRGAEFVIELPDLAVSNRLPASALTEREFVDFNRLQASRIVAADDNVTNSQLMREMFRHTHHDLFIAANGQDALQLIEDVEPDLVFMDIRMPKLDGLEAIKILRSNPRFRVLPVIAVTAFSEPDGAPPDREGFDGYVRKPFSRAELFKEMASFLPLAEKPRAPVSMDSRPGEWGELIRTLHGLESTRWPELRDGMLLSGVMTFAHDLHDLAESEQCRSLGGFAIALERAAAEFNFSEMERLIRAFPDEISSLERQAKPE
ncbi:MAG TPA: ATP-binding protein [Verrucomicrobiales bacterium]|nr:ATP-binding protein [Verrucomicrobiales bacterium]